MSPRRFSPRAAWLGAGVLLSGAAGALPALAGDRVEITPLAGYRIGGSVRETQSGTTADFRGSLVYGLIADVKVQPDGAFELIWTRQRTEIDLEQGYVPFYEEPVRIEPGLTIDALQAGGLLYLKPGPKWRPYIAMTLGVAYIDPEDPDLSGGPYFSASFAGGAKCYLSPGLGIRLEVRGYGTFAGSSSDIACSGGGSGGVCFVNASGTALWQLEATAGLILRF